MQHNLSNNKVNICCNKQINSKVKLHIIVKRLDGAIGVNKMILIHSSTPTTGTIYATR